MRSKPKIVTKTFPNGLSVIIQEDHSHPLVSCQYWVRTGSCMENQWLGSGLSHLLEHMVFKGTRSFPGPALAEYVQSKGGQWNAYTSSDRTVYYIDGPSSSWKDFLRVLNELVFFPSFPKDELVKEMEVIRREMAMYNDDVQDVAYHFLVKTLFSSDTRRYPVIGYEDFFNRLTIDDVCAYHEERYVPNNVFLVITGDVDSTIVLEAVQSMTRELSPVALPCVLSPSESRQYTKRCAHMEFDTPTSKLSLAWKLPSKDHPDMPALTLLQTILSSGRSARLYEKFHDRLGLVYDISAEIHSHPSAESIFTISCDVEHETRDHVRNLVLEELLELTSTDLSVDIARARNCLKAKKIKRASTVSGMARGLGMQWFMAESPYYYEELEVAFSRVSVADIQRVISTWLLNHDMLTETSVNPLNSSIENNSSPVEQEKSSVSIHTLSNGLRVILQQNHRLPIIYGTLAVQAGSPVENVDNAGISSLLSECMLKGTTTRSAENIACFLENNGGSISSLSGNNSLSVSFNVLKEFFRDGVELLADVTLNPSFPQEAVENERKAMIADVEQELTEPLSLAFRQLKQAAYGEMSYGLPTAGTVHSLGKLNRELAIAHHLRLFCVENAVLSLAGDFNESEAIALAEQYFSAMPKGGKPESIPTLPQNSGTMQTTMDKEQAVLIVAVPGVSVTDSKQVHAQLFNEWCSDMAGPIFTSIREQSGLAYYASSLLFHGLDTGLIIFYLGTSPDLFTQAQEKLTSTLENILKSGISSEEFDRARTSLVSAHTLARQSLSTQCSLRALDVLYGLPLDYSEQKDAELASLSLSEFNDFIATSLAQENPRTISIITP